MDHLPRHTRLLRRALDRFESDDRVEALVLSGSLAGGNADDWSDIDLFVIAADRHFAEVFAERGDAATAIGHPLAQFTVPAIGGGSSDHIVLYDDLVKLDLMYYRAGEVAPHLKWAHAAVLKDATGLIGDVQAASRGLGVARVPDDELLRLDQQFWVWCWYALGKIERGERWAALDAIHEIRTAAIAPLLLAAAGQPDEGYRRLESKAPDALPALARTVAHLDPESQRAALRAEISLFVDTRRALFAERGLPVNEAAEKAIRRAT